MKCFFYFRLSSSIRFGEFRKRILALDPDPYRVLKEKQDPVAIAVDSTGVKVHRAGGWVERKTGRRNGT
jgi:hypothetical protein